MSRLYVFLLCIVVAGGSELSGQSKVWTVSPQPTLTIGSDEGDEGINLQTIVFASRLPGGGVVIGDRGDFALLYFDATGKSVRSIARKGRGPGEIEFLGRMWRCDASLFLNDIETRRISVFTLTGQYVRQFMFGAPRGQQLPYHSACNRDGRFVHIGWERPGDARPGAFRSKVPVWTGGANEVVGAILDSVPGSERWGIVVDKQLRGTRPLPLGKQPVIGIGRAHLFLGAADRFEVQVLSHDGRRVGLLQRPESPRPVTTADVRAYTEREVANSGERNRARIEASLAAIEFPSTLPAYTHLVVDDQDLVWIRGFPRAGASTARWTVFKATGEQVAEVDLSANLEVFEIGAGYVLGRYLDPDEAVPQVRIYQLRRDGR